MSSLVFIILISMMYNSKQICLEGGKLYILHDEARHTKYMSYDSFSTGIVPAEHRHMNERKLHTNYEMDGITKAASE